MAVIEPDNMDDLAYFTNRTIDKGAIRVWVYKATCLKCSKGQMAKPRDKKTGAPKIRASEYVCSECGAIEEKKEHESRLVAQAKYKCPECQKEGEWEGPYKRKTIQGVKALRVTCEHCGAFMDVTKKMANKKPKKSKRKTD